MVNYRRDYTKGASYFFTLTLEGRRSNFLTCYARELGEVFRTIRAKSNFITKAMVLLPDHLHFIWQMPDDECDYSTQIRLIKSGFTQKLIRLKVPLDKNQRGQYNLWQSRFWEHRIRDDLDMKTHMDYIHYNPVKHGYIARPADWPYSSIHRYIKMGWIEENWGT